MANFIKISIIQPLGMSLMNLPDLIGPIVKTEPDHANSSKTVLLGRDDLLTQAVSSFLRSTQWDVTNIFNDGDADWLINEVRRIQPQVVILCRDGAGDSTLALRLIDELPSLRVIVLGLDNNHMQVYSKQNILLRGASDLLFIIENGHFPNCLPGKEVGGQE